MRCECWNRTTGATDIPFVLCFEGRMNWQNSGVIGVRWNVKLRLEMRGDANSLVMPGLDPGIYDYLALV